MTSFWVLGCLHGGLQTHFCVPLFVILRKAVGSPRTSVTCSQCHPSRCCSGWAIQTCWGSAGVAVPVAIPPGKSWVPSMDPCAGNPELHLFLESTWAATNFCSSGTAHTSDFPPFPFPLLDSIHRPSSLISLLQTWPPSPHFIIFLQLLALSSVLVFCLKTIGRSRRSFPSVLECSSSSAKCVSGREDLLRLMLGSQNRFGQRRRAKFKWQWLLLILAGI